MLTYCKKLAKAPGNWSVECAAAVTGGLINDRESRVSQDSTVSSKQIAGVP